MASIKFVVTLYYFLKVQYLNFNHVIIMKDFHNVFAYYDKSKPKKNQMLKKKIYISYDVMVKYIHAKTYMS
jgi:hypothetical protein